MEILWKKAIFFACLHVFSLYAFSILHTCQWKTILFSVLIHIFYGLGVTAGAHRLWCHRSYKAKLPLRIFLAIMNCGSWQNSIFQWSRDHRGHHKYSETDADPYNSNRGFFFCHIGHVMLRKRSEVIEQGIKLKVDDLMQDPVVRIQHKYHFPGSFFMCIILPTFIPWYVWGEALWNSYFLAILRHCITFNIACCVNSFAHMFGYQPYDKTIRPVENPIVSFFSLGEGFHNYHHAFPQDYSTSEFGLKLNLTTAFIDLMAMIGLAYDRKSTSPQMIRARKARTGEDKDS